MSKIDDLTRLKHIKEATTEAIGFVKGRCRQYLETERMLSLALVRLRADSLTSQNPCFVIVSLN